jgi:hypothetical protein
MKQPALFDVEKKRKKPVMLTGRSRKFLERCGFIVALVERNLNVPRPGGQPNFRNKFDAFGIADLIAVKADVTGTLYIQTTDFSHGAEHKEKILAAKASPVLLSAANRIELHLWKSVKKQGRKLWRMQVYRLLPDPRSETAVFFSDPDERWFLDNGQEYDPNF